MKGNDMSGLVKPFVVEHMVLVAVVGDEHYIFNRQHFTTWYGNILDRTLFRSQSYVVTRALDTIGAKLPYEYEVVPSSGLGYRTSFVFWFPAEFRIEDWRGTIMSLGVIEQENPRKARVIRSAYERVDPLLRAA
jgi:hypothetical protein